MRILRIMVFYIALCAAPIVAMAQGSAGGAIGNDDKSVSGSRPVPAPSTGRRQHPSHSESNRSHRGSNQSRGFDGMWMLTGTSTNCQGSGSGAFTVVGTRVTVAGGGGGRVSSNGAFWASTAVGGVSLTATGHLSSDSGSGSYRRGDGCVGRWTAMRQ
jgi:hypothetical protein